MKTSAISALNLARPISSFILLPVYLRNLEPSDYGFLGLLIAAGSIFSIVAGLRLNVALRAKYFESNSQDQRSHLFKVVYSTLILSSCSTFAIFVTVAFALSSTAPSELVVYLPLATLAVAQSLLQICIDARLIEIQNRLDTRQLGLFLLSIYGLQVILQFFFLEIMSLGILGMLMGSILGH